MTKRYTDEDISLAFENIHSSNLVIGMYIDDLKKETQVYKDTLTNLISEYNLKEQGFKRGNMYFAAKEANKLIFGYNKLAFVDNE